MNNFIHTHFTTFVLKCSLTLPQVREGSSGTLLAFIIPNISPKSCVSVSHRIKPLCLHMRIDQIDATRPTNELVITGESYRVVRGLAVMMCKSEEVRGRQLRGAL